jgi:hypothetical protein
MEDAPVRNRGMDNSPHAGNGPGRAAQRKIFPGNPLSAQYSGDDSGDAGVAVLLIVRMTLIPAAGIRKLKAIVLTAVARAIVVVLKRQGQTCRLTLLGSWKKLLLFS